MFNDGVIVEQFGIKTALSIIKDDVKKIEKKNFKNGLKDVSEQLGKAGSVSDFGFDVEQDIMKAIVGEPKDQDVYGKNVVGKDSISLSVKKGVNEINQLLLALYEAYVSNQYRENFDWFDNFSSISDKILISELDNKIIEKINNEGNDVIYWLSIPEVISWELTKCFRYKLKPDSQEYQDIEFDEFKDSLKEEEKNNISIEILKNKKVFQIDIDDKEIKYWFVYKCLYAEIDFNNEKYLLVSGKYYKVDKGYKQKIENEFCVDTSFVLPNWNKPAHENVYNAEVANNDSNYQCLDGGANRSNLIGKGKIEFADLVKSDKYLIHVKKYGASSVLSHLFSQGFVSANLLLTDISFRKKVNSKLKDSHKDVVTEALPNSEEYTIVYAIGTDKNELKLPFFSLVNFRNIKKQLELYKYKVLLIKINRI
ncbi:MAG: hypothetical protein CRN43_05760 [Candidatus Nephrothrix sp. EaCA]|nr:MAG: hypothetical protein CRN43_05760 [Candidatus Nephrothrix sp. EaCA]